jgi:hypothetical protein
MRSVRDKASANRTSNSLRGIFLDSDPHRLPTAFGAGQNVLGGLAIHGSHATIGYLDHLASVERGGEPRGSRRCVEASHQSRFADRHSLGFGLQGTRRLHHFRSRYDSCRTPSPPGPILAAGIFPYGRVA